MEVIIESFMFMLIKKYLLNGKKTPKVYPAQSNYFGPQNHGLKWITQDIGGWWLPRKQ